MEHVVQAARLSPKMRLAPTERDRLAYLASRCLLHSMAGPSSLCRKLCSIISVTADEVCFLMFAVFSHILFLAGMVVPFLFKELESFVLSLWTFFHSLAHPRISSVPGTLLLITTPTSNPSWVTRC